MNSEIANGFLHTGSKIIWTYNMRSLCSQQVYWSTFSFINDLVNIIQNADTETCRHQGTPPGAFCPPVTLLRKQIGHSHLAFPFHGIKIGLLQLIRQLVYWCSFQIPPPLFVLLLIGIWCEFQRNYWTVACKLWKNMSC
jgi:hypothetical protein